MDSGPYRKKMVNIRRVKEETSYSSANERLIVDTYLTSFYRIGYDSR